MRLLSMQIWKCRGYVKLWKMLLLILLCGSVVAIDPVDLCIWLFAPGVLGFADLSVVVLDRLNLGSVLFRSCAAETLVRVL
ncbi:hypothetical protein Hanom_Chr08g00714011 [Helianthus anomalus]